MERSRLLSVLIWSGAIVSAVAGFGAPSNVLDQFPVLAWFVEKSSRVFPVVRDFQQTSAVPQVAGLVAAFACWFAPLQLAAAVWSGSRKVIPPERISSLLKWSWFARFSLIVGMPIALGFGYWGLYASSEDPGICEGCANTTRVGLILFVGLVPAVLALISHAYIAVARHAGVLLSSPRRVR